MRFLCIYKPAKAEGAPPTPEMMETKIAQPALPAK
jgi:hypothetical protein